MKRNIWTKQVYKIIYPMCILDIQSEFSINLYIFLIYVNVNVNEK